MKIEWLIPAILDLQRLKEFILSHNREAAQRAVKVIRAAVALLETNPFIGKPVDDMQGYRDLVIPFSSAGYLLRYRIQGDTLYIVALRHAKEAGYTGIEG